MADPERDDDDDALVGDYVLGVLGGAERARVRARLESDAAFAALVWDWERRLAPMADAIAPVAPPADLYHAIAPRLVTIEVANSETTHVVRLRRQVNVWRASALAFGAIAAALTIYFAVPAMQPAPAQYVAVLETPTSEAGFVARIEKGKLTLKRVGAPAPSGRDYELWAVGAGREKPESLGVVAANAEIPVARLGGRDIAQTVLAISVEPPGGSPTGQATGPIVFTGKLVVAS